MAVTAVENAIPDAVVAFAMKCVAARPNAEVETAARNAEMIGFVPIHEAA